MPNHVNVFLGCMLVGSLASADTIIPGGNVSGTWTTAGSPYLVQGDITIHADSTLIIEQGVDVSFTGYYKLSANGPLEAVGTEADSIHFFPATTTSCWNGICINGSSSDTTRLVYCSIRNCTSPVSCIFSSPIISHSTIAYGESAAIYVFLQGSPAISHCNLLYNHCGVSWHSPDDGTISDCIISHNSNGGGICLEEYAELEIINCIISDNTNSDDGGGIRSIFGTLTLDNCTISANASSHGGGGGISCTSGTVTLTNCTVHGNACTDQQLGLGGGGICLSYSGATISYCSIYDNYSVDRGGGITVAHNSHLTLGHCTIDGNESWSSNASGVALLDASTADIANSIISNNALGYGIHNSATVAVTYTDFFNNTTGALGGNLPLGFGALAFVNANGDSCDVYGNIFLDPLYEDQPMGNLQLTWENCPIPDTTRSPCIDARDPLFGYDPDSTVTDLGRYWFDQRFPEIELSATSLDFGTVTVGASRDLPLTIYNNGNADLILYDIYSTMAAYCTNWSPANNLVLPNDSLEITITFTPVDTVSYADTLFISNNCEWRTVDLFGQGEEHSCIAQNPGDVCSEYTLQRPYPNPINHTTVIRYHLPLISEVNLTVCDAAGRQVAELVNGSRDPGWHQVTFDAAHVASGLYFCRIEAGDFSAVQRMTLLK